METLNDICRVQEMLHVLTRHVRLKPLSSPLRRWSWWVPVQSPFFSFVLTVLAETPHSLSTPFFNNKIKLNWWKRDKIYLKKKISSSTCLEGAPKSLLFLTHYGTIKNWEFLKLIQIYGGPAFSKKKIFKFHMGNFLKSPLRFRFVVNRWR